MTISKDVFLAILALDAYNRGYGAGISDGGAEDTDGLGDSNGTQIANATIVGANYGASYRISPMSRLNTRQYTAPLNPAAIH
jgi:hypothetical protein